MAAPKGVKILAALTLILTTGCASSPGGTSYPIVQAPVPDTLALELGEWNEAINTLTAQRNEFPASAEITYSLGLAYWGKLNSVRGNEYTFQHMGMLGREEKFLLSEALLQFNAASEFQPSDEVAAKSLYFAGQCLDIGNLQRFDEAMEVYRLCSDKYPGTEAGWRCLERYGQLRDKFDGIGGGSHGMEQ